MSVTTVSPIGPAIAKKHGRGLFGRMYDRMVESRSLQAERLVHQYLANFDDKTLESLGYDRKSLKAGGRSVGLY